MANNIAFQAMGKSVCAQSTTANTQSNVFTITVDSPCQQYFITNHDVNSSVNVRISTSNNFNIAMPDANGAYGLCIPPFGYKVFTGPQVSPTSNVYVRIISDGANIKCTVCPGEGF
jgi:hypothetical protein